MLANPDHRQPPNNIVNLLAADNVNQQQPHVEFGKSTPPSPPPPATFKSTTIVIAQTPPPPPPQTPSPVNPAHILPKITTKIASPRTFDTTNSLVLLPIPSNQIDALSLQHLSTTEMEASHIKGRCFRFLMTFTPSPELSPPKFVFIKSEQEPPGTSIAPHSLGIEDKAIFQGGSIDTNTLHDLTNCHNWTRKHARLLVNS